MSAAAAEAGGLRITGMADRAIIALPGTVWRSCIFAVGAAERLVWDVGLAVGLPADLAAAGPRRRSEYLAGRLCAALALRAAGAPEAVGRAGRAPVWPEGIGGSISHTGGPAVGRAMAVVSRAHPALGLDCEGVMAAATVAEVAPLVLTPADWAARPAELDDRAYATLVFSAKEAGYKAIAGRIGDMPEFREAAVEGCGGGRLALRFRGGRIPVHYRFDGGEVVTLAVPA